MVLTIWGASQFLHSIPAAGNDLVRETSLAAVGCGLGVLAGLATKIRRLGTGAFARAGAAAAALWVLGIGARVAFSLWVTHGGEPTGARFSVLHHITSGQAWVASFIFMAMAEVVSRTGVMYLKARRSGAVIERYGLLRNPAAA